jgi:hypothetical protein
LSHSASLAAIALSSIVRDGRRRRTGTFEQGALHMTKHMPAVPPENRSKKGPGDHREIASDTTHAHASGRPEHVGTGRRRQHKAEHDQQGFFQGRKMK